MSIVEIVFAGVGMLATIVVLSWLLAGIVVLTRWK
jgi:hypothetical protein